MMYQVGREAGDPLRNALWVRHAKAREIGRKLPDNMVEIPIYYQNSQCEPLVKLTHTTYAMRTMVDVN